MTFYKVLDANDRPIYGDGTWYLPKGKRPGRWMPVVSPIVPCRLGYHVCDGTGDLLTWLGPNIYEAEGRGETVRSSEKTVFAQARLLRRVDTWNERTARLFAADCAEWVLPLFEAQRPNDDRPRKAIDVARAVARGELDAAAQDAARDAARSAAAAWDAARPVARAAARDAAWDAARAAAWAAAWDAARAAAWAAAAAQDAAWSAAWAAARDAAWAAARDWQAKRLAQYLQGEAS